MTKRILNIGSLNIDDVFSVEHFVQPGETVGCRQYARFLGGKGNNQSIALGRAGADVAHAGKIGAGDQAVLAPLREAGVDVSSIAISALPSGRALIQVDASGQNCIILYGGANHDISCADIDTFLQRVSPGDAVLFQNEISNMAYALRAAKTRGMFIYYNPSPISDDLCAVPLDEVDSLILNEVEGQALSGESDPERIVTALRARCPHTEIVLTLGKDGVLYDSPTVGSSPGAGPGAASLRLRVDAKAVHAVDTTAAGDTFTGYFIAARLHGESPAQALDLATRAAALCVTRTGAAPSIPWAKELE